MAHKNTAMAFVAVFFGWIGIIIALLSERKDKYVMFYTRQSLALLIFQLAGLFMSITLIISGTAIVFLSGIFGGIIIGFGLFSLFGFYIAGLVLWLIAWINALSEKEKRLPLLQWLADKFHL